MLLRLRNWVVVIGLVLATGGHWAALQSIAWVGMTIKYSRGDGLITGLQKTFDGSHPCNLCKAVQQGREAEKKQALGKLEIRGDLLLSSNNCTVECPVFADEPTLEIGRAYFRADQPPAPPPRFA